MEVDNESGDKLACWRANFASDSFMSLSRSVSGPMNMLFVYLVYLGFNVAFKTVQVISRQVVGRAEETST